MWKGMEQAKKLIKEVMVNKQCRKLWKMPSPVSFSSQKDVPPWDVFECLPPPPESESMQSNKCFEIIIWILKIFIYGLLFTIILCSGITSKFAVLLATAQLGKNQLLPSCNHTLGKILIYRIYNSKIIYMTKQTHK